MYGFEDDVIAYQSLAMPLAKRQRNGHYIHMYMGHYCLRFYKCLHAVLSTGSRSNARRKAPHYCPVASSWLP